MQVNLAVVDVAVFEELHDLLVKVLSDPLLDSHGIIRNTRGGLLIVSVHWDGGVTVAPTITVADILERVSALLECIGRACLRNGCP